LRSTPSSSAERRPLSRDPRFWVLLAVCIAIAGGLVVFATHHSNEHHNADTVVQTVPGLKAKNVIRVGQVAPTFRLAGLNGGVVDTAAYKGRPYAVTFWGSWCIPCQKEMPALQKAYAAKHGSLPIVGVTYQDPASDSRAFVRDHHITFPIAPDDGIRVAQSFGVINVPSTFVVDSHGVVRARVAGDDAVDEVKQALESVS
jgi:peroxiredoxin